MTGSADLRMPAGMLLALLVLGTTGCGQISAPMASTRGEPGKEAASPNAVERYDLERDEERGGHTLKKHVGRTDAELQQRLQQERNISAASTWTSREAAEATVAAALRSERGRIENWIKRGYPRANLALHYDRGQVVGRSLRRGDSQAVECTSAVIVLRADGPDDYYVLTTYPEARE